MIFIIQKLLFMLYNFQEAGSLSLNEWIGVIIHGLRLDFSAVAYLMAIPILLISILSLTEFRHTRNFIKYYNAILLFFVLFLGVSDMELYSWWGVKLDIAPLVYLKTPREAAASLKIGHIILLVLFFVSIYLSALYFFRRFVFSALKENTSSDWKFSITGLLTTFLLLIPMRGGIGIAPINLGSVYFSSNRFANNSAINVFWNCIYSVAEKKGMTTSHHYMEKTKANQLFVDLYPPDSSHFQLVKKDANVLLIILESFSNKIIGSLGGEAGITPQIDSLKPISAVFTNFFASGDRSEKGMLCLFSGYPSQPTTSIINFPGKTQHLPFLTEEFHKKEYYTSFYYGGDLNFANFRSYFTNPYMDRRITLQDFPDKYNSEKWGVPDEVLFEKMNTDLDTVTKPFFISCFTLSSHEPYDVPMKPVFPASDRNNLSKNAFYYSDKCLGEFIQKARSSKWWDNTLIIIVADHGSRYPGNTPNHIPQKFRIPMIWTGGAVLVKDTLIGKYCNQTDLARTLLNQFGLPVVDYKFSKDILGKNSKSFSMYFFNNGLGYMSDSVKIVYDNNINDYIFTEGNLNERIKETSKAYLQVLSDDFNSR
jgi:phosphoglycerol transferase MdoB-like AlkP superfamily enzyme